MLACDALGALSVAKLECYYSATDGAADSENVRRGTGKPIYTHARCDPGSQAQPASAMVSR